jgi:hypothetical protein
MITRLITSKNVNIINREKMVQKITFKSNFEEASPEGGVPDHGGGRRK